MTTLKFTVPGLEESDSEKVIRALEERLTALIDLELTLKHIHWNVVGENFIAVHEMLDPQVVGIRAMVDAMAERIATLGGVPVGTPGAVAEGRQWSDYRLGKATVLEHLGALDVVYAGVNESHRKAIAAVDKLDPVSADLLTTQLADLELYQWFVRAHLESGTGTLPTSGVESEEAGARSARQARGR